MDIRSYLQSRGFRFDEEGKNVSAGWIGLNCPFCDDPSNHLGINPDTENFNCFRCSEKGGIIKLVKYLEGCSWSEAYNLIEEFTKRQILTDSRMSKDRLGRDGSLTVSFPSQAVQELLPLHRAWLESRRFPPDSTFHKYNLRSVGMLGDWMFRLIIPIYMGRRLVSYVGRDVTGKAKLAYKNCPNEQAIVPVHHSVYNIDNARDGTAIVMEGVTDVWRFGDGAVGLFGTKYTKGQVNILSKLRRAFVMLDADAGEVAEKLAYDLSAIVPSVEIIQLPEGDPDDLPEDEVLALKVEIFGRI